MPYQHLRDRIFRSGERHARLHLASICGGGKLGYRELERSERRKRSGTVPTQSTMEKRASANLGRDPTGAHGGGSPRISVVPAEGGSGSSVSTDSGVSVPSTRCTISLARSGTRSVEQRVDAVRLCRSGVDQRAPLRRGASETILRSRGADAFRCALCFADDPAGLELGFGVPLGGESLRGPDELDRLAVAFR